MKVAGWPGGPHRPSASCCAGRPLVARRRRQGGPGVGDERLVSGADRTRVPDDPARSLTGARGGHRDAVGPLAGSPAAVGQPPGEEDVVGVHADGRLVAGGGSATGRCWPTASVVEAAAAPPPATSAPVAAAVVVAPSVRNRRRSILSTVPRPPPPARRPWAGRSALGLALPGWRTRYGHAPVRARGRHLGQRPRRRGPGHGNVTSELLQTLDECAGVPYHTHP